MDPEDYVKSAQPCSIVVNTGYDAGSTDTVCSDLNISNSKKEGCSGSDSLSDVPIRSTSPDSVDTFEKPPPNDGIRWEEIPRQRKLNKITSVLVCSFTGSAIIAYGAIYKTEITFKKCNTSTSNKNITLYTREEKVTYPAFFILGLGLLGIILGLFLDRICQIIEEICQCQLSGRYKNFTELVKKSFSGISWKTVGVVTIMLSASCILGRKTELKIADAIYVLGGIGVGPLLIQLLNLNTESEIAISTILEKKKMYPGYILAWSYYIVNLKEKLGDFNSKVRKAHPLIKLSLNRIILLLTQGTDDLIRYDEKIKKLKTKDHKLPLYTLTLKSGEHKTFAMICIKEPLVALKEMKELPKVPFVDDTSFVDELKRFYKTLTEIIEDAPDDECRRKGLVVPVTVKIGEYHMLKHGGLVRIILEKVDSFLNDAALPELSRNRRNAPAMKKTKNEEKEKKSINRCKNYTRIQEVDEEQKPLLLTQEMPSSDDEQSIFDSKHDHVPRVLGEGSKQLLNPC